jgi:hypothetical protein
MKKSPLDLRSTRSSCPGDVIVGEAEGVVVLPAHLADALANEATEMIAFEDFVQERVLAGRSILGMYPPTDEAKQNSLRGLAPGQRAMRTLCAR